MSAPSVCLCLMVRDEAAVIERCLASARPWFTSWLVMDTGSVDGTQDVVRAALAGVPGELVERPWVDFGHNRTELVRLARGRADLLLLLDADMTIHGEGPLPDPGSADSWLVRHDEASSYFNKRLVRGDRAWRYDGATHEVLVLDEGEGAARAERVGRLDGLVVRNHADGGARADKFERDRRLLEAALARDPSDARARFYLAQTFRDLGDHARAIEHYEQRAAMPDTWEEEAWYAAHQAAALRLASGPWPTALAALIAAHERRPHRAEPLHALAGALRERALWSSAFLYADLGVRTASPREDILFVDPAAHAWGCRFERSIAAYWVGDPSLALADTDALLAQHGVPDAVREKLTENRRFSVDALARSAARRRAP